MSTSKRNFYVIASTGVLALLLSVTVLQRNAFAIQCTGESGPVTCNGFETPSQDNRSKGESRSEPECNACEG